ncbi:MULTISPECIES: hypothetical protein [Mycobacterium]|uniref:hypothetical protein n=1 Tax=Mycobacterium TaxID=1763 RepID=UPI000A85CD8B|nr:MULTISPECIES: hypothetical protein [Mycobacterium]MDP7732114.1 hypothetical protein [Mycobacterium sp. TY813]
MPERRYVYRLVVDHWPTPDGKPFADQPLNWWEVIAACASSKHADPDCACPTWLRRGGAQRRTAAVRQLPSGACDAG